MSSAEKSCTRSRKRKRNAGAASDSSTPKRPKREGVSSHVIIPNGYGYVLEPPTLDEIENGVYCPRFTNRLAKMFCDRCNSPGKHWEPFCPRPICDPPETEEEAAQNKSWKYILRNFNLKEYLEKQQKLNNTQGMQLIDDLCFGLLMDSHSF